MAVSEVEEDGNLPAAFREFEDAVTSLVEELHSLAGSQDCPDCCTETCEDKCELHTCPGHPTPTDSLYQQLFDSVHEGRTGGGSVGSRPRSIPTGWIDAQQILDEIDTAVGVWCSQPVDGGDLKTPLRLRALLKQNYRPQDCHGLNQKTQILQSWRKDIEELFDPKPRWTLPNPCPACNTSVVYRMDSGGDNVRQPALQIGPNGCKCLNCHTVWEPRKFVFLAKVLGCLPDNVLE